MLAAGLHGIKIVEPLGTPDPSSIPMHVAPEVMQRVRSVAQGSNTSMMTVVLAAFGAAAAEALGLEDVLVNLSVSGRDHPAVRDVVSSFSYLLPISLPGAGLHKSQDLLQSAASQFTEAMQHSIPRFLIQEAAGDLVKALSFLSLNVDLDLTRSCPDFHGLEASRLGLQGIAPPYGNSMLVFYIRTCLFLRADAEGGLRGGLAFDPRSLEHGKAQLLSGRFNVSMLSALGVLCDLVWHVNCNGWAMPSP